MRLYSAVGRQIKFTLPDDALEYLERYASEHLFEKKVEPAAKKLLLEKLAEIRDQAALKAKPQKAGDK